MKIFENRRKNLLSALAAVTLVVSPMFVSCESTSTIGSDLVADEVSIVVDSSFTVTGRSVTSDSVLSRTVVQMIGVVDAPSYGYIYSDFVTQFMPANSSDTTGVTVNEIDSIKLVMLVNQGSYVGDSLAIMGLEVFSLTRQLQTPMYSNFDPTGYYDASTPMGSLVYNLTKATEPDSLQKQSYFTLSVDLPLALGQKFYNEYKTRPSTFATPTEFVKFFPGIYVRNSYGSGRITRVGNTTMQIYYRQKVKNDAGNDTTYYKVGTYFAVTPEIITNNDIKLRMSDEIKNRIDEGQTMMVAPIGLDVELNFPAKEIIESYKEGSANSLGVVNALSLQIPVEDVENKYDIGAPQDVLLVLKKDRDKFFRDNQLPDNEMSFRATLATLPGGGKGYVFSDMIKYILKLMKQDTISDDDMTFVLMPVTVASESNNDYYGNTTSTVTAITPYVTEPKMTQILLNKSKIKFVYSKQTTNF